MFASLFNFLLPKYCARNRDPQAWKIDARSFQWFGLRLFVFPPFSLLPKGLEKVVQEEVEIIGIALFWPQKPFFPRLLSFLVGLPRVFTLSEGFCVGTASL